MKELNIGKLIRKVLNDRRIKIGTFAESMNVKSSSASRMLNTSAISTDKVVKISSMLNYNFFREMGELLEIAEPANQSFETYKKQTDKRIAELEKALASSEKENALLSKVVDAMMEKKKK